jgi:hypothetical protein
VQPSEGGIALAIDGSSEIEGDRVEGRLVPADSGAVLCRLGSSRRPWMACGILTAGGREIVWSWHEAENLEGFGLAGQPATICLAEAMDTVACSPISTPDALGDVVAALTASYADLATDHLAGQPTTANFAGAASINAAGTCSFSSA